MSGEMSQHFNIKIIKMNKIGKLNVKVVKVIIENQKLVKMFNLALKKREALLLFLSVVSNRLKYIGTFPQF